MGQKKIVRNVILVVKIALIAHSIALFAIIMGLGRSQSLIAGVFQGITRIKLILFAIYARFNVKHVKIILIAAFSAIAVFKLCKGFKVLLIVIVQLDIFLILIKHNVCLAIFNV